MDIIGKEIAVVEAAKSGLYAGALRNDDEYEKVLVKLSEKIKIGWMRRLTAAMLGRSVSPTVGEAIKMALIDVPLFLVNPETGAIRAQWDYRVHDDFLLHEIAQLVGFFATRPNSTQAREAMRSRRKFHSVHQFKGFTQIKPRGTEKPSFIPIWVLAP